MKALKRMSSAFGYSEIEPETDLVEPFAETEDEYVNEDDSTDYYDDAIIEDREPNPDLARICDRNPHQVQRCSQHWHGVPGGDAGYR